MSLVVQRTGALGLLVLLVAVMAGATVMPFTMAYLDRKIELDVVQERQADLIARRKDPAILKRRFESLMIEMVSSGLMTAASDDETQQVAEQQIRAAFDKCQVPLTTWSVLPGGEVQGLRAFRAELAFVVPSSRVLTILSALENGRPTVFFERLVIRSQEEGFSPGRDKAGQLTEVSGIVRLIVVTPDSLTRERS